MVTNDSNSSTDDADPAAQLTALRTELLGLLEELPETRLSKPTPRHGWTLRHELAWLAASDQELLQRLELSVGAAADEPHWRRVRGEAMHAAQELRLAALRDHLEASSQRVAASLEGHRDRLDGAGIGEAINAHAAHTRTALTALRAMLAK